MRSSTSSSNDRLPRGGWVGTWGWTLVLAGLLLGGLEGWWRLHGFTSEVQASDEAWVLNLLAVPRVSTVAIGTSRIRSALDPEAYQRAAGGARPVNLAMPGGSPIPVLEYLADSTAFAGTLIVDLMPLNVFDSAQAGAAQFERLLRQFARERVSPGRLCEAWLRVHVIRFLVFRSPQLLPLHLVETLRRGGAIAPTIGKLRPDGFAPRDQRRLRATQPWDAARGFIKHDFRWMDDIRPASAEVFAGLARRINRAAGRLVERGGTVVFLNMVACGDRRGIEERLYPRTKYWDLLAIGSPALVIASEDFPSLSGFECFDGSHLDAADAAAFSTALGRLVRSHPGQHGPLLSPMGHG